MKLLVDADSLHKYVAVAILLLYVSVPVWLEHAATTDVITAPFEVHEILQNE